MSHRRRLPFCTLAADESPVVIHVSRQTISRSLRVLTFAAPRPRSSQSPRPRSDLSCSDVVSVGSSKRDREPRETVAPAVVLAVSSASAIHFYTTDLQHKQTTISVLPKLSQQLRHADCQNLSRRTHRCKMSPFFRRNGALRYPERPTECASANLRTICRTEPPVETNRPFD